MTSLAVHYDFSAILVDDARRRRRVAELLMSPCFDRLARVSAQRGDRWVDYAPKSVDAIDSILADRRNSELSLDNGRRGEMVASAAMKNGAREGLGEPPHKAYLAFPTPVDLEGATVALLALADALDAGAGFIACEPNYDAGQNVALEGGKPRLRPGVSTRRATARRGRHWHYKRRHAELAGPEWGTFLGAAHLARLDIDQVRASGAFVRVELISPRLAYLQVTGDPADDLREDFEARLEAARLALAPILMDLSDVTLD